MDTQTLYDLLIVGGGINGAGIGHDASSRGLKVLLVEQNDLASGTSSQSSKLVHGGLRYLEHYDFALVRESLQERQRLLQNAPHLVHGMRFVIPYFNLLRPYWFLRLGLFIYDLIGPRKPLKRSKAIHFKKSNHISPLKLSIRNGFIYSDCVTDDARLVIANALKIKEYGGAVATYTKCIKAEYLNNQWEVTLHNQHTNDYVTVHAKVLINATGPWVNQFIKESLRTESKEKIKLVKGTHIILPKLYEGNHAYLLQNKDRRVIFVVPYLNHFTLIGTTESNYTGDPKFVKPEIAEIEYLCDSVNQYFHKHINRKEVLHAFAGVRPLLASQTLSLSNLSRGYKIEQHPIYHQALINVYGGKLTTYRKLSENVVNLLYTQFPLLKDPCTENQFLPGGHLLQGNFNDFKKVLISEYPQLSLSLLNRYAHQYGSISYKILANVKHPSDLGQDLGHGLHEKELEYLIEHEWAYTVEDILWRRTKLGLVFNAQEIERLDKWLLRKHTIPVSLQKGAISLPSLRG